MLLHSCSSVTKYVLLAIFIVNSATAAETDTAWLEGASLSLFYDHSDSSDAYRLGFDKHFSNGFSGSLEIVRAQVTSDDQVSASSYTMELSKALNYSWLISGYVNQWDGADAVESTAFEGQIDRLFDQYELGVFFGQEFLHLTGTGFEGNELVTDLATSSAGVELRFYPSDSTKMSFRYSDFSHDFTPENLDIERRPALLFLLSPDSIGIIGGLLDRSISVDANILVEQWLIGATYASLVGAVNHLTTQSVVLYADYDWSKSITLSIEIGEQSTETYSPTRHSGFGARFSW